MDGLIIVGIILLVAGGIYYSKKQKAKGRDLLNRPIDNRSKK